MHGILYSPGSRTVCKRTSEEDMITELCKGQEGAVEGEKKMYVDFRLGN